MQRRVASCVADQNAAVSVVRGHGSGHPRYLRVRRDLRMDRLRWTYQATGNRWSVRRGGQGYDVTRPGLGATPPRLSPHAQLPGACGKRGRPVVTSVALIH